MKLPSSLNPASPLQTVRERLRLAQVEEDPDNAANLSFARCQVSSALGNKDKALEDCLSALEASPADAFDRPLRVFSIGTRMAGAGLDDEAMELLQSLAEPRIGYSRHWYLTDRRLEGLREHPDWPALMEALEPDK